MTIKGQRLGRPLGCTACRIVPEFRFVDWNMGNYFRIYYHFCDCCCAEGVAENWNMAEYDSNWTLYRFIQLAASRFQLRWGDK